LPSYLRTGTLVFAPAMIPFNVGAYCASTCSACTSSHRSVVFAREHGAIRFGQFYGVYLSQMIWIPFLLRIRNHFGWHIRGNSVSVGTFRVYFVGFIFTALAARTVLAKALTGRSQATWRSLMPKRHETPHASRRPG